MKDDDSIFGASPEGLERFMFEAWQEPEPSRQDPPTAPAQMLLEQPGGQIDRYKLLSILGEGGMGIVYLAEQERPVKRQVALKVIKPGMDSKRVLARFEAEQQALALMEHPHIARVHDAGLTPSGRSYFVMEHVKGVPITEYCDKHRLTIEERLILFLHVCEAVQHAHQKGIVHRDIKPSNILITTENEKATPKVIDFGVARAISQPLTERTLYTEEGQLVGTPEYMSPEQADMASEDIDTRSDIYSLGVLLYVLLTGVMPFDPNTFREGGIERIRQIIREADPKTPSTMLSRLGEEASKIAENRRTEIRTLAKRLHKELEWIPLKAMRKQRVERYRSASELADDIEDYLKGAPLVAGPPSALYRLRKFMRRNRALVTGIAALVAVLTAGVIVSTIFAVRAERQARTSQAISDFLSNDLLTSVDPVMGVQQGASLESILDVASQRLEGKFGDQPLIEASIRHTIGRTYTRLGKYNAAESNLKRAIELRRERLGTIDQEILVYMQELGWVYFFQSRYDKADLLLAEAVGGMRRILSGVDPILLTAVSRLSWVYQHQGRYEEAEKLQAEALEVVQRRLGPEHPYAPGHMEGLAAAYSAQGRFEEATELCRKALDICRRLHGEEHYETLNYTFTLAQLCRTLGRYAEAEELYAKTLEGRRRLWGEEHRHTLTVARHLGSLYRELERYDEAEQLLVPALETNGRLFGEEDQATLRSMIDVAELYRDQGHYNRAEQLSLKAEGIARRVFGNDHEITNTCVNSLIDLYEAWNKPEKAKEWRTKLAQTGYFKE
jgi:serine/threonine protein kinase